MLSFLTCSWAISTSLAGGVDTDWSRFDGETQGDKVNLKSHRFEIHRQNKVA